MGKLESIFVGLISFSLCIQSPVALKFKSVGTIKCEIELKSSPGKFWGGIKNSATIFPKIYSNLASIEVLPGDGSLRLVRYAPGSIDGRTGGHITFAVEKNIFFDDENKSFAYAVIAGEVTSYYKYLEMTIHVVSRGEGSLVKWSADYEKASEDAHPQYLVDNVTHGYTILDDYLMGLETTHCFAWW